MRTYRLAAGRPGWASGVLVALVLLFGWTTVGGAQDRRYLVEVGAAGAYQSFDKVTDLGGAAGGIGRLGIWLPPLSADDPRLVRFLTAYGWLPDEPGPGDPPGS